MVTTSAPLTQLNPFHTAQRIVVHGGWQQPASRGQTPEAMRVEPGGDMDAWLSNCRVSAFTRQFCSSDRSSWREASHSGNNLRVRSKLDDQAQSILEVTRQLFPPGALDVQPQSDPDEPTTEYLVIDVQAEGEIDNIMARSRQWHEEVSRIISGDSSWLRLCVYPR